MNWFVVKELRGMSSDYRENHKIIKIKRTTDDNITLNKHVFRRAFA